MSSDAPRSLVTGGAGFLGSHLARELVGQGQRVRIVDNLSTGSVANLLAVRDRAEFIYGDTRELDLMRAASRGIEYVYHLAAGAMQTPLAPGTMPEPVPSRAADFLNVLIAAREAQVRRVVFASSCTVYGLPRGRPVSETDPPAPITTYALAKLAGEKLCQDFYRLYGLETVSLRLFNVYGAGLLATTHYAGGIVLQIIKAMLMGHQPIVSLGGGAAFDLLHVNDAVRALVNAAQSSVGPAAAYNIGSGVETTAGMIVDSANRVLGSNIAAVQGGILNGDICNIANIAQAEKKLMFRPIVSLESGIRQLIRYYDSWRNLVAESATEPSRDIGPAEIE